MPSIIASVGNEVIRQWTILDFNSDPLSGMTSPADVTILLFRQSGSTMIAAAEAVAFAETGVTGHYYLTFRVQGYHRIHGMRFVAQLLFTLVLNYLFIQIVHDAFGVPLWFVIAVFAVLMPGANFLVYQVYTFRQRQTFR